MLGSALLPCLDEAGHQVHGVDQKDFDICDAAAVQHAFRETRPDFVFHLAAFADVDGCELNPAKAEQVNAQGTRNVARACAETGAGLLYVSTDYVFDGNAKRPYREDDCPHPESAYGLSKLRGEQYVQALVPRYVIARAAWLFGPNGKNFVATILRLASERPELRIVADQRGSPTYTRHLASKLVQLFAAGARGVFHVTGSGICSWFEFTQAIVRAADLAAVRVTPITSLELARPAKRPEFSVLENGRLADGQLGLLPHWTEGLAQYLEELRAGR